MTELSPCSIMQLLNIKTEYADKFNALVATPPAQATASVQLKIDKDRFPYLVNSLKLKIKSMMVAASFSDNAAVSIDILDSSGSPALDGNPTLSLVNSPRFGNRIKYGTKQFDIEVKNADIAGALWDWAFSMPRANAIKLKELFLIMEYELKP